ncbi:MAG TPA: gluconate 5-dehydrogenase [Bacteroidales bacterium]|nr:gluconate 5-dehydrogenase [Bacteroidales bacterium]
MDNTIPGIFGLEDKKVWVFGGAGHLGKAAVLLIRSAGAKVLCVDMENRSESFVETGHLCPDVIPVTLDVRDGEVIKKFVAENIKIYGTPDGMVNLTFASTAREMADLTETEFDEVNHGGLTATFLLAREVGSEMVKAGHGSIVLFSSMYGLVSPYPEVYQSPMVKNPIEYGVGKAGIIQMTRYLAVSWGKSNVRCNCISPGPFPNPSVQQNNPAFIQRLEQKSPMGRIGNPSEIAGAVVFLVSEASSYITGHNLIVDGGWTCW